MDHQDGENDPLPDTEAINLVPIFFRFKGYTDPHIIVVIHPNLLFVLAVVKSSSMIKKIPMETVDKPRIKFSSSILNNLCSC